MATVRVTILGQPDSGSAGLTDLIRSVRPGATGRLGSVIAHSADRAYTFAEQNCHHNAVIEQMQTRLPADIAVVVVPAGGGARPGTREQVGMAMLRGVGRFVLYLDGTGPVSEAGWLDLIEVDARESLAAIGLPADDIPVASTINGLFEALDGIAFRPRSAAPTRLTVCQRSQSRQPSGRWFVTAFVERGVCRVGDTLELVGFGRNGRVVVRKSTPESAVAGEYVEFLGDLNPGGALEAGQGLAEPGSLVASDRFGLVCLHWTSTMIYNGTEAQLVRGGLRRTVQLTEVREVDDSHLAACRSAAWFQAICVAETPLLLEAGDRVELQQRHRAFADGFVADLAR